MLFWRLLINNRIFSSIERLPSYRYTSRRENLIHIHVPDTRRASKASSLMCQVSVHTGQGNTDLSHILDMIFKDYVYNTGHDNGGTINNPSVCCQGSQHLTDTRGCQRLATIRTETRCDPKPHSVERGSHNWNNPIRFSKWIRVRSIWHPRPVQLLCRNMWRLPSTIAVGCTTQICTVLLSKSIRGWASESLGQETAKW